MQDAFDADTPIIQPEEDHVGAMDAGPQAGTQIGSDCVGEGCTCDPVLNFWSMQDTARANAIGTWKTNLALIGGLLIAAAYSF